MIPLPPVTFDDTNRAKPDGHCQECAKDIPVGRRLCGRCMSKHRT